jgi:hypothetical protein
MITHIQEAHVTLAHEIAPMFVAIERITGDTQENANRVATILDGISAVGRAYGERIADQANDLADEYVAITLADLEDAYDATGGNQAEIDLANLETAEMAAPKSLDTRFPSKPGVFERDGVVYRIKAGSNWAKVLQPNGKFEYVGAVNWKVRECDRISMERAIELSVLTSSCCICGRTLTNPDSVAAGIGPICSGRTA